MHEQQYIFKDFSVDFLSDKINIILGENGAGKTTLFDSIAGTIKKNEQPISNVSVAYKLQSPKFFPNITVQEILNFFTTIGNIQLETESGRSIREQCLLPIYHRKVGQISGGELQLLFNYGTHLLDRDLYLFDEPTAGVSFSNSKLVLKMMQEIVKKRGKTVILTLHDLQEINEVDAQIITIKQGKLSFSGTKDQLLSQNNSETFEHILNKLLK